MQGIISFGMLAFDNATLKAHTTRIMEFYILSSCMGPMHSTSNSSKQNGDYTDIDTWNE